MTQLKLVNITTRVTDAGVQKTDATNSGMQTTDAVMQATDAFPVPENNVITIIPALPLKIDKIQVIFIDW